MDDDELVAVQELDEELRMMLEDPDKYLSDATSNHPDVTGAISIPPKLYGQERPMERLMNAYQSVFVKRQNDRGVVLISGRAGSGKVGRLTSACLPFNWSERFLYLQPPR